MKILINFIVILSIILVGCSDNSSPESVNGPSYSEENILNKQGAEKIIKVFPAVSPVIIDGLENDWKRAPKHKLREELDLGIPIENKDDLTSYFKMLWDNDNLYFFVSIQDEDINVDGTILYERDGFEIYIDGDNSKNIASELPVVFPPSAYDSNDDFFRFIPTESSALSAYSIIDASNFEFEIVITRKGYDLEVKIPFTELPDFPGEAGHVFGIEFQNNDNDDGVRQNSLKWNSSLDESYFNPSLFGTAVLFKD